MKSASPTEHADLQAARQARIDTVGFRYDAQPVREVERCNLCGNRVFTVLTHRDRYHYPASAAACRSCALTFLSPVMTPEAYGRFYVDTYRPLVSAFHGRLIDAMTIQAEQREYAEERAALLDPFIRGQGYRTLLDIGGSTGVVAHAFARRFNLTGTVLDPAPLEIQQAQQLGLETIIGMVETYDNGGREFDLVTMCQTIDHLLDIAGTLAAIRRLMRPDGVFFVDIVDFRAAYLRHGSIEAAVKIDHPYYLTEPTTELFLARAGLRVERAAYAADRLHVSYVCRPDEPRPDAAPLAARVAAFFDEIRFVQNARAR